MARTNVARGEGAVVGRMARALVVLVLGWCVLCASPALAGAAVVDSLAVGTSEVVLAQNAPPGPDLQQEPGQGQQPSQNDVAVGIVGIVLIGLVLLSRRARKKPLLFFRWKK